MKILIVEDEPPIAREIENMIREIAPKKIEKITLAFTLKEAMKRLLEADIDLCMLDLNLGGNDGYDLLKQSVSGSFHTIIVSAHTEQAIEAFNYGVLDFLPKPVNKERLSTALNKYMKISENRNNSLKYLVVRRHNSNHIISIDQIFYFEAQRYIVKIHLRDKKSEIIEKSLNRLMQILPSYYIRTHRSYIVNINDIEAYSHIGGGVYNLELKNKTILPLSPQMYKKLKSQ